MKSNGFTSFASFMNQRKSDLSCRYPFLSQDQIISRLRQQWRRMKDSEDGPQGSACEYSSRSHNKVRKREEQLFSMAVGIKPKTNMPVKRTCQRKLESNPFKNPTPRSRSRVSTRSESKSSFDSPYRWTWLDNEDNEMDSPYLKIKEAIDSLNNQSKQSYNVDNIDKHNKKTTEDHGQREDTDQPARDFQASKCSQDDDERSKTLSGFKKRHTGSAQSERKMDTNMPVKDDPQRKFQGQKSKVQQTPVSSGYFKAHLKSQTKDKINNDTVELDAKVNNFPTMVTFFNEQARSITHFHGNDVFGKLCHEVTKTHNEEVENSVDTDCEVWNDLNPCICSDDETNPLLSRKDPEDTVECQQVLRQGSLPSIVKETMTPRRSKRLTSIKQQESTKLLPISKSVQKNKTAQDRLVSLNTKQSKNYPRESIQYKKKPDVCPEDSAKCKKNTKFRIDVKKIYRDRDCEARPEAVKKITNDETRLKRAIKPNSKNLEMEDKKGNKSKERDASNEIKKRSQHLTYKPTTVRDEIDDENMRPISTEDTMPPPLNISNIAKPTKKAEEINRVKSTGTKTPNFKNNGAEFNQRFPDHHHNEEESLDEAFSSKVAAQNQTFAAQRKAMMRLKATIKEQKSNLDASPGQSQGSEDDRKVSNTPFETLFQDPSSCQFLDNSVIPYHRRMFSSAAKATPSNFESMFDDQDIFM